MFRPAHSHRADFVLGLLLLLVLGALPRLAPAQTPVISGFGVVGEPITAAASADFVVQFNINVVNVDASDFGVFDDEFNPVVGPGGPSVTNVVGTGAAYLVTVSSNGATGLFWLGVPAGNNIAAESGGAPLGDGSLQANVSFVGTRPYPISFTNTTASPGNYADLELVFSEPVTGVDPADFRIDAFTPEPFPTIGSVTGGPTVYTVRVLANGVAAFCVVSLPEGASITAQDDGASMVLSADAGQLTFTPGPPAGSIGVILTPRNTMPDFIFVQYDKAVQNFSLEELSLVRDGATPVAITGGTVTALDGRSYEITDLTYASAVDGNYVLTLSPGNVTDLDGAAPVGSVTASFELDATGPKLISSTTEETSPTTAATIIYRIEFDGPVAVFPQNGILIETTGTASGTVSYVAPVSGSSTQYDVGIAASGDGTISVGVRPGGVFDAAGNGALAGAMSAPILLDNTLPSLMTFSANVGSASSASEIVYTLVWSEPVSGLTVSDFVVAPTNLTFGATSLINTPGGVAGRDYTFTVSGIEGGNDGQLVVSLLNDAAVDAVGLGSIFASVTRLLDRQAPQVTFTRETDALTYGTVATWRLIFDEPVSGFGAEDITVNGSGFSYLSAIPATFSPTEVTLSVAGISGVGDVTITLAAGGVTDARGNGNIANTSQVIRREEPSFSVGGLTVFAPPSTTITTLGGGNYDITAGAIVNSVLLLNTPIQIRGTTISGNGTIGETAFLAPMYHTGQFSIDGTTGIVTFTSPRADIYAWNGVPVGLCSLQLSGAAIYGNGWFAVDGFDGNSFEGLYLNTSFRVLDSFWIGPSHCDRTGGMQFTCNGVAAADGLSFSNVQPVIPGGTTDIFDIKLRLPGGGGINGEGSITHNGARLDFSDVSTSGTTGMNFDVTFETNDSNGAILSFDPIVLSPSGTLTIGGGVITNSTGDFEARFDAPTIGGRYVLFDTVTLPTTTGFGDIAIEGIVLDTGPKPAGLQVSPDGTIALRGLPFGIPDGAAFDGASGLTADTLSLVDLNGISLQFTSLAALRDSVFLGGGGFEVLGLSYNIDIAEPDDGSPGLKLSGGFSLPDNLEAISNLQLGGTVTISDSGSGPKVLLNGLEFCTPTGPEIKIKKSNFNLPQLCFTYDEGPPQEISGDITVGIPDVVDVTGGLTVLDGKVDRVTVGVDGLNAPIDATGAYLQSISGQLDNLARSRKSWKETYYVISPGNPPTPVTVFQSGIAPIKVTGTIGATAGPTVLGQSLISAEVTAAIDETQLRMDGTVTLVVINVGGGYVHARWSGPNQGVALGGYMTYLLVIRGSVDAALDFDGNFSGCAAVTVRIPDGLPFAGSEFGGVSACISAPPFQVKGCVTAGAKFCMTISEDGSIALSTGRGAYRDWETPFYAPMPIQTWNARAGKTDTLYMTMFDNYRQAKKIYGEPVLDGAGDPIIVTMTAGDSRIIRLTYQNSTNVDPSFTLTSPSGAVFTPTMVPGAVDPNTAPALYFESSLRRESGYALRVAEAGDYVVNLISPDTLGSYSIEVLTPNAEPTIEITDVAVSGGQLLFHWNDIDPDDNATIALGLDLDRYSANGSQILTGISEDDETDMASYDLAARPIQAGFYWPYAIIRDAAGAPVVAYATAPIYIPDVDSPLPIDDFQVTASDGRASISFTPVNDPNIVSYKLSWTDDPLDWNLVNSSAIPLGETNFLLPGLKNGHTYKFVLSAVSRVSSSASGRAERFAILDRAVAAARTAAKGGAAADLHRSAANAVAADPATARLALQAPAQLSLARQAAEIVRTSSVWEDRGRVAGFEKFIAARTAAAKNPGVARDALATNRYTDGYLAVSDTVTIRYADGTNNPPEFRGSPATSVALGTTYSQQLTAVDPEGDAVTFALASGPAGLTVSPTGLVQWNTAGLTTGDRTIEVTATDSNGAAAQTRWILSVVTIVMPPPFAIVSTPNSNVALGETWTYTPALAGLANGAAVTWALETGPGTMSIDPATGALSWDTTGTVLAANGLASVRVILKATESGTSTRTALQEFTIDVETRSDRSGPIEVQGAQDFLIVR